jgi:hypothetical protein
LILNPSKSPFKKGRLKSAHLIKNAPSFVKEGWGGFGFKSPKAAHRILPSNLYKLKSP